MVDDLDIQYEPDRNNPLGGTVVFADGDYEFPLHLCVDKLEDLLRQQAAEYGDEIGASRVPTIQIRRDDCVYDVGYRPDSEIKDRRAAFIARRDRDGQDLEAYTDLDDVVQQTGLHHYDVDG